MNPIRISLNDYELSGGGANGESYNHKSDPGIMLKLYLPGKIQQPLDEMLLARKVYDMGIPTPEPGDYVVTDDGRYGIRFRRILGKKSFARAIGDNPELVGQYAEDFADMCLKLHKVHVDTTLFECVKDRYYRLLEANPFFTPAQKDRIGRFIADAPDTDTAIHGDLQYGNVIFTDTDQYFIDLGDFCYGYNLFDVGMVYLCCVLNEAAFIEGAFHMSKPVAIEFWKNFAQVYFGKDRPLKDIEEEIRPYAGLKTLIVERDTKRPMPELREGMSSLL